VLSHLADPIGAFQEMHRALKSNGLLVFETGNIADVDEKYMKYFSQFSYPDHLFFFGEKSLNILLERTGFKMCDIQREQIILQLILQKVLWRIKDSLKDEKALEDMTSQVALDPTRKSLSPKRQLRNLYRYARHYLVRCGKLFPKQGRPLKLLAFARKVSLGD
jgi:hypothetical protein